jgi:hypothetical protein
MNKNIIEYLEIVDKRKADYIIENYELLKDNFRASSEERLKFMDIDPLTLFKKYISKSKKVKGLNNSNQILVKYKQNNDIGRYWAVGSLSLQNIPREIRHTISNEYYYDIDIKNCHPSLICQYAEKNELECSNIKYYIENREQIFNEMKTKYDVNKDDIKTGFLSILNGGKGFLGLKEKDIPEIVKKYKNDVELVQKYIFEHEEAYKESGVKNAKKKQEKNNKSSSNELGSTMNIMLCDIENNILQTMINFLKKKKLFKTSLVMVFDGFMIYKNDLKDYNIDKLLNELEEEVFNYTQFKIKLEVKPMNNLIDVPDDYKCIEEDNLEDLNVIKTDSEGADKILKQLEGKLYMCKDVIYYKYDNKWENEIKIVKRLLKNLIMEVSFVKNKKATKKDITEGEEIINILGIEYCNKKYEHYSADNAGASNILDVLLSKIPIKNDLNKYILNSSKHKIFFKNGYYDFKKLLFIDNFDNVETMIKIERNFGERNLDDEQKVLNILFKPIFREDTNEALLFFSRALAGEVADKLWAIILGSRDAGKGVNQDALMASFQDYVTSFNADSLLFDVNGGDAAKKLSWAYDFDKSRLAFSNEMKIDNSIKLDGNLIKKLCSGGDEILTRKNNIDEKRCQPQTTCVFCCNDIPKIDPNDVYEKLIPFSIKTKFIESEITEEILKENPYYHKSDPYLRDMVKTEEWFINAVTHLIINSYKPEKVKLNDNMKDHLEAFQNGDNIFDIFNESFEITRNEKDKVDNKHIKEFITGNKLNISFPKIVNLYMSKGINNKVCKINNKSTRGFIGLKIKVKVYDNDEDNHDDI